MEQNNFNEYVWYLKHKHLLKAVFVLGYIIAAYFVIKTYADALIAHMAGHWQ